MAWLNFTELDKAVVHEWVSNKEEIKNTLIDLHMLNYPFELGMNSTWLWCMIFLCDVGFGLLIFC